MYPINSETSIVTSEEDSFTYTHSDFGVFFDGCDAPSTTLVAADLVYSIVITGSDSSNWLSYDPTTRILAFTPVAADDAKGTYGFTVHVGTYSTTYATSNSFSITLTGFNNQPTFASTPSSSKTVQAYSSTVTYFSASDADPNDSLTY